MWNAHGKVQFCWHSGYGAQNNAIKNIFTSYLSETGIKHKIKNLQQS